MSTSERVDLPPPGGRRLGGLLWKPAFRRLWLADALSQFGTQVSLLAVPLVAINTLQASTLEVALLTTLESAAFLLIGLPAGAWSDRLPRRPVLIAADLGRAVLLAAVPLAYALHGLHMALLYAVVFLLGVCTVFFDVTYQSFLPAIVDRDELVEGNGKLEANRSVAGSAGPPVGGFLVQLLTAPVALLIDTLTYLWSAAFISRIRVAEHKPAPASGSLRSEISAGMKFVLRHSLLRPIAFYGATYLFFSSVTSALLVVFLARTIGVGAAMIGVLFAAGNVAALAGAISANRLANRFGPGPVLIGVTVLGGAFGLLVPLARPGWELLFVAVGLAGVEFCVVAFNVIQVSFRQRVCPEELLGRMNATMRFLLWGTMPLGSAIGGVVANSVGVRPTLAVAAVGSLLASGILLLSPLRRRDSWP